MKHVAKFLLGVVILLLALFAVANRGDVTLSLSPLPFELAMPVYAAILGAFALGLVIGTALAVIGRERMRLRARAGEQRARTLETKLAHEHPPVTVGSGTLLPASAGRARFGDD